MEEKIYVIFGLIVKEYYPHSIYVIERLITKEICNDLINFIDKVQELTKSCNVSFEDIKKIDKISQNTVTEYDNKIFLMISNILCIFRVLHPELLYNKDSGYKINKISESTKLNVDTIHPEKNTFNNFLRCVSVIINVNNSGIYNFPSQNVEIKLQPGDVLLYPPYWTHPYTISSIKDNYTINTWILEKK
jgi:hypothetical protein